MSTTNSTGNLDSLLLEMIFDTIPTAAILDPNGVILSTNKAWGDFAQQNDLTINPACIGISYLDVCDNAVGIASLEANRASLGLREILYGKREEFILEYPCHSPEEQRWFVMRVRAVHNHPSAAAIVIHEDITNLKLAALRAQILEEEKFQLQDGFVKHFSHDIRTLLTATYLKLHRLDDVIPDTEKATLRWIERTLQLLGEHIFTLIQTFEFEQKNFHLSKQIFDLRRLLEELLDICRIRLQEKGLALNVELENIKISGEESLLKIAFLEVLSNAIDYTPPNGKITIRLTSTSEHVYMEIEDTGIGIPRDDLSFIFDRFFRVDRIRPTEGEHVGLGLTLAKRIIELHEGSITAKSSRHGSLFTITLPC